MHDPNTGRGKLTPSEFEYERRKDRYRCPEDHYLYPYEKTERGSVRRYRIIGDHCRECPMRGNCLPDGQKFRARFVYRGVQQAEVVRCVAVAACATSTISQTDIHADCISLNWHIPALIARSRLNPAHVRSFLRSRQWVKLERS